MTLSMGRNVKHFGSKLADESGRSERKIDSHKDKQYDGKDAHYNSHGLTHIYPYDF